MSEQLAFGNIQINFPYVPYECQRSFMKNVVEALTTSSNAALESPTGTGKTLSLLCASIAWLQSEKMRMKPVVTNCIDPTATGKNESVAGVLLTPKIFYASRTHSQLQQVVRELNKTEYKEYIKVATLAGRDQLCINEKVLKEENNEIKSHLCRTLVKNRKCHFYNTLDKEGDTIDYIYKNENGGNVLDIEDLVTIGKKLRHCPFYRSRQMDKSADLILLPYNYILDPKTRSAYDLKLRGNILIFDEAHNLGSIAEDSVSIDFSTKSLALCIEECKSILSMIHEEVENVRNEMDNSSLAFSDLMKDASKKEKIDEFKSKEFEQNVAELLQKLFLFETKVAATDFTIQGVKAANGRLFPGSFMTNLLIDAGINKLLMPSFCRLIDKMGVFLAISAEQHSGIWSNRGEKLNEFSNFLSKVFVDTFEGLEIVSANNNSLKKNIISANEVDASCFFQLYVELEGKKIKFHYWCFSPGVAMRFIQSRGVRSIIMTSGTLAPINEFVSSMGINFNYILESGHAAKSNQLVVGTLKEGFERMPISGTKDASYLMAIGKIILNTIRVTPQGVLAFFPSYSQLETFIDYWQKTNYTEERDTLWNVLKKQKKVFVEPKNKNEVAKMFFEFDSVIRESNKSANTGGLLLAVCRGKLSEGIDFADSHSRAVIIVGIPFPPAFDPRILLKKTFLQDRRKKDLSVMNPEEWYKIEGWRAVNQALGRIIRHKDDFGAVILADSRYSIESNWKMFPAWIRSSIRIFLTPKPLFIEIERFFIERSVLVEQSQIKLAKQKRQISFGDSENNRKRKNQENFEKERNDKLISDFFNVYGEALQLRRKCNENEEIDNSLSNAPDNEVKSLKNVLKVVSSLPDSEKTFPINLTLCESEKKMSQTFLLQKNVKKRIKLKANIKIGEITKNTNEKSNILLTTQNNTIQSNLNKNYQQPPVSNFIDLPTLKNQLSQPNVLFNANSINNLQNNLFNEPCSSNAINSKKNQSNGSQINGIDPPILNASEYKLLVCLFF